MITPNKKHMNYLNFLADYAKKVEAVRKSKHAAMIWYKGDTFLGINQLKSHPFQKEWGKNVDAIYLHSEIDAIKNALKGLTLEELAKSTLYICRVKHPSAQDRSWVWGNSKPCLGCARAIAKFNIKEVIYTLDVDTYDFL